MFDLITGTMDRPLREPAPGSKVTSIVVHAVVLTLVVVIPLLRVTNTLPDMQTMMAFAVESPAPPPPPPPPPPPAPGGRRTAAGRGTRADAVSTADGASRNTNRRETEATTGTAGSWAAWWWS